MPAQDVSTLVLTCPVGESIEIGADIVITVVRGQHNRPRLSIQAPRDLQILRTDAKVRQPNLARSPRP